MSSQFYKILNHTLFIKNLMNLKELASRVDTSIFDCRNYSKGHGSCKITLNNKSYGAQEGMTCLRPIKHAQITVEVMVFCVVLPTSDNTGKRSGFHSVSYMFIG